MAGWHSHDFAANSSPLRTASPVIAALIEENTLKVVAGCYDLRAAK